MESHLLYVGRRCASCFPRYNRDCDRRSSGIHLSFEISKSPGDPDEKRNRYLSCSSTILDYR